MRRLLDWLGGVLAREEAGTSLALLRIGAGLCVLHIVVPMSQTGAWKLVMLDAAHGGYRGLTPNWLASLLGGATPEGARNLLVLLGLSGLALTLGLGGRLTALVTGQALIAFFGLHTGAGGGHDRLLTNAIWLLVLGRASETLSLDCWLRTRRLRSERPVAAWPRWLAVWQLVVMYTATGLQKVGVDWTPWGGFTALYKALLMPNWRRWDMDWIAPFFPLTQLGTALTLVFEIGAPVWLLALWYRETRARPGRLRAWMNRVDLRSVWVGMGVALHAGIHLFMNVGPFSFVTLSYYACLYHPDEWRALARRLFGR